MFTLFEKLENGNGDDIYFLLMLLAESVSRSTDFKAGKGLRLYDVF